MSRIVPEPMTRAGGEAGDAVGQVRQHVDRVGGDEDDPVRVGLGDRGHDLAEDGRVLADEVDPRLARLLGGAGRDDRDRGAGTVGDRAGPDARRARERDGVHQVHRLALRLAGVGVDEDDLGRQAAEEEAEGEGGADGAGAHDGDTRGMGRRVGRRGTLGKGTERLAHVAIVPQRSAAAPSTRIA